MTCKNAYNRIPAFPRRFFAAVLIIALAAMLFACKKGGNDADPTKKPAETAAPESVSASPFITEEPTPEPTPEPLFRYVTVSSAEADDGLLVLVNYSHEYAHTDEVGGQVILLHGNTVEHLLLTRNDHALLPVTVAALNEFAEGFYAASGGDRLLVTSAYRTVSYQQQLFADYAATHGEDMARIYVADPGCSEHHTGYAVDLSTMSRKGERIALIEHAQFDWVKAHCTDYGFILRYPVGSQETTHVAFEPWHFRYIGVPAAKACTGLGMLYEEFIDHLKAYSADSGALYLSIGEDGEPTLDVAQFDALPESGYIFYFVAADPSGETRIPVPAGLSVYTVSGSNDGGFIVMAELGK